jgi:hypothetical protein
MFLFCLKFYQKLLVQIALYYFLLCRLFRNIQPTFNTVNERAASLNNYLFMYNEHYTGPFSQSFLPCFPMGIVIKGESCQNDVEKDKIGEWDVYWDENKRRFAKSLGCKRFMFSTKFLFYAFRSI